MELLLVTTYIVRLCRGRPKSGQGLYNLFPCPWSLPHGLGVRLESLYRTNVGTCVVNTSQIPFHAVLVMPRLLLSSFSSAGQTHTDLAEAASPSKMDYQANFEQLVTSFGSEKAKRAHAAHQRNKVESSALESALATAVSHAQSEMEKAGGTCR